MSVNPTVSIIIPLYNHGEYIDEAIDSLLQQTFLPSEIIIINDGSTDDSWQRVQKRALHEPRIIAWSQENQGAHNTINAGLRRATGDYLAILNSDDRYHPQRLEFCLKAINREPKANVIFTSIAFINNKGASCSNKWYKEALLFYQQINDLSLALINGNFLMTTSNLFMHRSVFESVGDFANFRYAHDLDFFLRLILSKQKIAILSDPLLHYRIHPANTISESVLKVKMEWAAVVAYYVWCDKQQNWSYWDQLVEITDRHDLTRLLFFFFKFFQQHSSDDLKVDSWLSDPKFCRFIADTVR